ncbi:hypothetical protein, partial [Pseudomonas viridiflava]|uniref:hypothetical protein n=1 Tax=Pseudomonas viridiflava TaxID=33069 RepID=UPI00197E2ED8
MLWEAPPRRRNAVTQQKPDGGRRLAGDAVDAVFQENRIIVHRRQAASYQTTCKPLNEIDFVGGGLPAMQTTRYVRKIASSFIAGKPPPTVRVCCATALRRRR